jgi:hypothetical protein
MQHRTYRLFMFLILLTCGICPAVFPQAVWIRHGGDVSKNAPPPEGDFRYFRRPFMLESVPDKALLRICADERYTVWLNGAETGSGAGWRELDGYRVEDRLIEGRNVLAVRVEKPQGVAALTGALFFFNREEPARMLYTGRQWRSAAEAASEWQAPDFDDRDWRLAAVPGPREMLPWRGGPVASNLIELSVDPLTRRIEPGKRNDGVAITWELPAGGAGKVTCEIADIRRQAIARFEAADQQEGVFVWHGELLEGGYAQPGDYAARLSAGTPCYQAAAAHPIRLRAEKKTAARGAESMRPLFPAGISAAVAAAEMQQAPPAQSLARAVAEIKARGFSLALLPELPFDAIEPVSAAARRSGARLVLTVPAAQDPESAGLNRLLASVREEPAVWGYRIGKGAADQHLDRAFALRDTILAADPARPVFTVLAEEKSIPRFLAYDPGVLVFSCNPLREDTDAGAYDFRAWIALLERLRKQAGSAEIPYWVMIPVFDAPGQHRCPAPAELRLMTWLAVAHGARGIFFESSEAGSGAPFAAALCDLAAGLNTAAALFRDARPVDYPVYTEAGIEVQVFKDTSDTVYFVAVNPDVSRAIEADLHFPQMTGGFSLYNVLRGTLHEARKPAADGAWHCRLLLPAGAGGIFTVGDRL